MSATDPPKRVLVTGGAGFIGANLAIALRSRRPAWEIVAFDSLRRRGSELNIPRLREAEVEFVHGDVREQADLDAVGDFDAVVECSAEPSALAGTEGRPKEVVAINLDGAVNCLEAARNRQAQVVFLSTSRVYPVEGLNSVPFEETETRFEIAEGAARAGHRPRGSPRSSRSTGPRTLYGATKLAAEHMITEYADMFGLPAVDRSLRSDRRSLADGEGRPGRLLALDAGPLLRPGR